MAYKDRTVSVLPRLLALTVLLAVAGQAVAGRGVPTKSSNVDKKQPEWLLDPDGSLLIPGIGRVMVPPQFRPQFPMIPSYGSVGPVGGGTQIPGGDDTFVPPGPAVPIPDGNGMPPQP